MKLSIDQTFNDVDENKVLLKNTFFKPYNNFMKNSIYSGILFLLFLCGFFCLASLFMPNAVKEVSKKEFENSLMKGSRIHDFSRDMWGSIEWRLFQQGRQGAVRGKDGRLYAAEEVFCTRNDFANLKRSLHEIGEIYVQLQQKNILAFIVTVPPKAYIYGQLPACKKLVYETARRDLAGLKVPWINGYSVFIRDKDKNRLYLRTDTHWSAYGAAVMASEVKRAAKRAGALKNIKRTGYRAAAVEEVLHQGDLTRYFPGTNNFPKENVETYRISMRGGHSIGLMDDYVPEIVLAGTSYSRSSLWNFEGFLKLKLKADIANVSEDGAGPFKVMRNYMNSTSFQNNPPEIIIWEIPERYMLMGEE